jgi:hypothetical protein
MPQGGPPSAGLPQNGLSQNGMAQNALPQNALPQNGLPQNGLPQNGLPQNVPQQNGQAASEGMRPAGPPPRQPAAGPGPQQYPQGPAGPFGSSDQGHRAQFHATPPGQHSAAGPPSPSFHPPAPGPYSGPQPAAGHSPAPPPVSVTLTDAVQAAHVEGFGFGEAVARDAPALWLEAVLARKPRMPSDLEARLLQGSALPIDSLLHDEVRHALRRGFWDALERSRR